MTDLRALAEAATRDWFFGPQSKYILTNDEEHVRFIAAASPAVVLALLDVVEAAREYVEARADNHPVTEANAWGLLRAALARYEEVTRG